MLQFPATATTLHYEFYTEEKGALSHASCIHLENVDRLNSLPSEIMDGLIEAFHVPKEGQVSILYLRKGYSISLKVRGMPQLILNILGYQYYTSIKPSV